MTEIKGLSSAPPTGSEGCVELTEFVLPNGRKRRVFIELNERVRRYAEALIERGYRFEIELLRTGMVHMDVSRPVDDVPAAMQVCANDAAVVRHNFERTVARAAVAAGVAS